MITHYKHISMRGDTQVVTEHYAPIIKRTRAGNNGKRIMCPHCETTHIVYHFSWSSAGCPNCRIMVPKYFYLVDQLDTWRTPR